MTKENRFQLLDILQQVQNCEKHAHHDIMTITGFMKTEQELIDHIISNYNLLPEDQKAECTKIKK